MILLISGTFKCKHYNKTFAMFHNKYVEVQYLDDTNKYQIIFFKNERKEKNKSFIMKLNPLTMKFFTLMSRKNTFVCCNGNINILFVTESNDVLYNCLTVLSKIQRNFYGLNEEFVAKKETTKIMNIIHYQSKKQETIPSNYSGSSLHTPTDKSSSFDVIKSPKYGKKNTIWQIISSPKDDDNMLTKSDEINIIHDNKFFFNSKMARLTLDL